jgi:hypothetical protein
VTIGDRVGGTWHGGKVDFHTSSSIFINQ